MYYTENKYVKRETVIVLCIRISLNTVGYCQVIKWNWCFSSKIDSLLLTVHKTMVFLDI